MGSLPCGHSASQVPPTGAGKVNRSLVVPHTPASTEGQIANSPRGNSCQFRPLCCCDYFLQRKNHHNSCPWIVALRFPRMRFLPLNFQLKRSAFVFHTDIPLTPQGRWVSAEYPEDWLKAQGLASTKQPLSSNT